MRFSGHKKSRAAQAVAWALCCVNFLSASAIADDAAPTDNTEIIVVSALSEASLWHTSPASVARSTTNSATLLLDSSQLLQHMTGIQADNRANFAQDTRISIRGFGSRSAFGIRGLLLLQDGIPLSTPDGQGQLSSVLLDSISYVEVLKGPMAALYGNASGGVISLFSAPVQQNSITLQNAHSSRHNQQQLKLQWAGADSNLSGHLKQTETQGYRPHSRARKQQAQLQISTLLQNNLKLVSRLDYANDPLLQDPLGLNPQDWRAEPQQTDAAAERFNTNKASRHRQLGVTLSQADTPEQWQLSGWRGDRQIRQLLAFTGSGALSAGGIVDLRREFHGLQGQYQLLHTDTLSLLSGVSYQHSRDTRLGFVNQFGQQGELRRDQTDTSANSDSYLRANWQPADNWTVSSGWRYSKLKLSIDDRYINADNPDDSGKRYFSNHATALGINYRFSPALSGFISAGSGFETPTLSEIAYITADSGINLALNASTNQQFEGGFKWQQQQLQASLSYFVINTDNEIVTDTNSGGRTTYRNAAQTQRNGAEFELSWQPNNLLEHQFSASWLSARYELVDAQRKTLPGVAKLQLNWHLHIRPWDENTRFSLYSRYRSKVFTDDSNSISAPPATVFSLQASHLQRWQQFEVRYMAAVDNLTDKAYVGSVIVNQSNGRSFEPAPQRQLSASLTLTYNW